MQKEVGGDKTREVAVVGKEGGKGGGKMFWSAVFFLSFSSSLLLFFIFPSLLFCGLPFLRKVFAEEQSAVVVVVAVVYSM